MEAGYEDGVIDGVKGCAEVEEDEDGEGTSVGGSEDVVGDLDESGFSAVE